MLPSLQFSGDGSEGVIEISGSNWDTVHKARDTIVGLVEEPEVGKTYK